MRKENRVDIYLYYTYRDLPPVKEHVCGLDFSYDLDWYHTLQHWLGQFDTIYVRKPPRFEDGIGVSGYFDDEEEHGPEAQVAESPASSTDHGKTRDKSSEPEKSEPAAKLSSTIRCEIQSWWMTITNQSALMIAWTFANSTWSEY